MDIRIYQPEKVIFTKAEGRGEYHFWGLINPYVHRIEVNNCFVIWQKQTFLLNWVCYAIKVCVPYSGISRLKYPFHCIVWQNCQHNDLCTQWKHSLARMYLFVDSMQKSTHWANREDWGLSDSSLGTHVILIMLCTAQFCLWKCVILTISNNEFDGIWCKFQNNHLICHFDKFLDKNSYFWNGH